MAIVRKSLDDVIGSRPKTDWSKVDAASDEDIRRQMAEDGEDPQGDYALEASFSPQVVRKRIGMTQEQFAVALGIPVATLRNWEQGRNAIDPAARSLLLLVARDPDGILAALRAARSAA